ncbi:MAG: TetR/AcrR family transcriptional regulator [Myxococcota bacterium]
MATKRKTRAEHDAARTKATTARILEAACEALIEVGYARTTTLEICRRAGVARGTMLHHFPDRDKLMCAALRHIFDRRFAEAQEKLMRMAAQFPETPHERIDQVIDHLWEAYNGDSNLAWLELVTAARTQPSLAEALRDMMPHYDKWFDEMFAIVFPPPSDPPPPNYAAATIFVPSMMNGLILENLGGRKRDPQPSLNMLKAFGRLMIDRDWR